MHVKIIWLTFQIYFCHQVHVQDQLSIPEFYEKIVF